MPKSIDDFFLLQIKSIISHEDCWLGCDLPYLVLESVGRQTIRVCDAWPVRHQTYGYLPSRRTIIAVQLVPNLLLGNRGTCVSADCPRLPRSGGMVGSEWVVS